MGKIIDLEKRRAKLEEEKHELELMEAVKDLSIDIQFENYIDWRDVDSPTKLIDFIEKVAVWYELRYPDYEVNKIIPYYSDYGENASREMFVKNTYVQKIMGENTKIDRLNWSDFYNFEAFYNTLPDYEKEFLSDANYPPIAYFDIFKTRAHIFMDTKGNITSSARVKDFTNGIIEDKELEGLNIKDVESYFNLKGLKLDEDSEINEIIHNVDYMKKGLLNAVMYRIINRGKDLVGPRRALLFAIEFKCDLEIPMIYGMDTNDSYLRQFINMYLDAGGNIDIICIDDYFYNEYYPENWRLITLREVLKNSTFDRDKKYSEEESNLHTQFASDIKKLILKKNGR